MLTVYLRTYGCQMNTYDSEVALGFLKDSGFQLTENEAEANVVLFNTCSVREHAETRVYGQLHRYKHIKVKRPGLILGLLGCMVEEHQRKLFEEFPHLDLLCGTRNLKDLPQLVRQAKDKTKAVRIEQEGLGVEYLETAVRKSKMHAYLPIMTGCDKACTYCIVPVTRGKEVSVPAPAIYHEAERLASSGVKHITLLGQNVNSYGKDETDAPSFAELLKNLCNIESLERISFTTSHPEDAVHKLFEIIRDHKKISRRFHLPLQSGSNKILKRMKRLHTFKEYKEKIDLLRKLVPNISVTTDIIVGFPGETEADYQDTKKALEEIRFDGAFIYKYSERPGTPAAKLTDDVPFEIKKERNQELLDLQNEITRENNQNLIGCSAMVLIEEPSAKDPQEYLARSTQDKKVVLSAIDSQKVNVGDIVEVKLESLIGDTFRAKICPSVELRAERREKERIAC